MAVWKVDGAYSLIAAGDAPREMRVTGVLDYSAKTMRTVPASFPEGLQAEVLDLSGREDLKLPAGLRCYELNLSDTYRSTP